MRSTIKDVARKANVSIATVSLVIHNSDRISSETRKKVMKAIKELNYHPSRSARGLVSNTTGNIGFILTDDHFLKTEPFYTKIFLGAEFEAHRQDYYILMSTVPSDYKQSDELPRFVLEQSVDGIIIAGKVSDEFMAQVSDYNIPIVMVDYFPPHGEYSTVVIDNIKGGFQAVGHLIDYGHKSIAFIGGDIKHPSIAERLIGYKQALENSGISIDNNLIITNEEYTGRQNGYEAVGRLLKKNKEFTAVFACNDAMAIGVIHALRDNGFNLPGDVSVIGFDDVEADLIIDPPLTTIRVPKFDMGAEALRIIVSRLRSKDISHNKILMPVELVVRKSTKNLLVEAY